MFLMIPTNSKLCGLLTHIQVEKAADFVFSLQVKILKSSLKTKCNIFYVYYYLYIN